MFASSCKKVRWHGTVPVGVDRKWLGGLCKAPLQMISTVVALVVPRVAEKLNCNVLCSWSGETEKLTQKSLTEVTITGNAAVNTTCSVVFELSMKAQETGLCCITMVRRNEFILFLRHSNTAYYFLKLNDEGKSQISTGMKMPMGRTIYPVDRFGGCFYLSGEWAWAATRPKNKTGNGFTQHRPKG